MFHSRMKKRIPYDSEIVNFIHRWLQLDKQQFDTPHQYHALCVRIHDCCCLNYFGIKLIRNKIPGHKPHTWANSLNKDLRRDILDDATMGLTPVPQVLQNSRSATKVDSPNTKQTRKPNKDLRNDILDDATIGPPPVPKIPVEQVVHMSTRSTTVSSPTTKQKRNFIDISFHT